MESSYEEYLGVNIVSDSEGSTEQYIVPAHTNLFYVNNPGITNGNFVTPNPIEFSKWQASMYSGTIVQSSVGPEASYSQTGSGILGGQPSFPLLQGLDPALSEQGFSKLYEQIRGSSDLSIDLLQGGQTKRMARAVFGVYNYVKSFHPRKWGDKWLEYQYGWKPLVQTLYDVSDKVKRQATSSFFEAKGRAKNVEKTSTRTEGNDKLILSYDVSDSVRFEVVGVFATAQDTVEELAQWSSLNPASIAWELVPYSFVVDWMIDIGQYLRNLESRMIYGSSFVRGYYTWTQRHFVVGVKSQSYSRRVGDYSLFTGMSAKGSTLYVYKKRVPFDELPFPDLPRFRPKLGAQRILSAASLLSQHLNGKTRDAHRSYSEQRRAAKGRW